MEGYDVDVLNEVSNDLYCMICLKLMRNPVQFRCGHGMCYSCYKSMVNKPKKKHNDVSCPQCRELIKEQYVTSNIMLHRLILSLEVKCNRNDECLWLDELSAYDDHVESCPQLTCNEDALNKIIVQRNKTQASRLLEDDILTAISQRMSTMEAKLDLVSNTMNQTGNLKANLPKKHDGKIKSKTPSTVDVSSKPSRIKSWWSLKIICLVPLLCVLMAFLISGYHHIDQSMSRLNKVYFHVNEISKSFDDLNTLIGQNTGSIKQLSVFQKKAYFNFEHLNAQFDDLQSNILQNTKNVQQMSLISTLLGKVDIKTFEKFHDLPRTLDKLQASIDDNVKNIKELNNQNKFNLENDIKMLKKSLSDIAFLVNENFKALGLLLDKSDLSYNVLQELPKKFNGVPPVSIGDQMGGMNQELMQSVESLPEKFDSLQSVTQTSLMNIHKLASINLKLKLNDLCSSEQEIMKALSFFYVERNYSLNTLDQTFYAQIEQARHDMKTNVSSFEKEALKTVSIKNRLSLKQALNTTIEKLNENIFPHIKHHYVLSVEQSKLEAYKLHSRLDILNEKINSFSTEVLTNGDVYIDVNNDIRSLIEIKDRISLLKKNITKSYQYLQTQHLEKVVSKQNQVIRSKYENMVNNFYINMKQVISFEEQFHRLLAKLEDKDTDSNNAMLDHINNVYIWKIENWKNFGRGSFTKIGPINNLYLDYSIFEDDRMKKSFLEFAFCPDEGVVDFNIHVTVWNQFQEDQMICLPTLNDVKQLSLIFDVCKYFKTSLTLNEMKNQGFIRDDVMYVKLEVYNVHMKKSLPEL